jgi:ribosomal protein S30
MRLVSLRGTAKIIAEEQKARVPRMREKKNIHEKAHLYVEPKFLALG